MKHHQALLSSLAAASLLLVGACSSTSSRSEVSSAGEPVRVACRDYRTGTVLTLLSESHTQALDLYSRKRGDASTKVQTDDLMEGLLEYLEDQDFGQYATIGSPPSRVGDSMHWSLEIEGPGGTMHVISHAGTSREETEALNVLRYAFLETYNATEAWQSVEVQQGATLFESPIRRSGD